MASSSKQIDVSAGSAKATVNATVTDSMPAIPCPGPAGYRYVGARYVPVFADPIEWSSLNTYEPLTIVTHEGASYTSKGYVPTGIDIGDMDYWAPTGNYNAQFQKLLNEVNEYLGRIGQNTEAIENETAERIEGDSDLSAQISRLSASIGSITSDPPVFVDSASEMTDISKVYVLSSNAHVYAYDGSAFTDTGVTYAMANAVHYDMALLEPPAAPYNNMDTFPANAVYLVYEAAMKGIANGPTTAGGILMTYGTSNYMTQLYVDMFSKVYVRYLISGSSAAWKTVADTVYVDGKVADGMETAVKYDRFIQDADDAVTPYNDFDTFPADTVVAIGDAAMPSVLNAPASLGGIALSMGVDESTYAYVAQIFVDRLGVMYSRYVLNGEGTTAWKRVALQTELNESLTRCVKYNRAIYDDIVTAPYDNFNTFPNNEINLVYEVAIKQMQNAPTQNGGISITMGDGNDAFSTQLFVSLDGHMFYRYKVGTNPAFDWRDIASVADIQQSIADLAPVMSYGSVSLFETIGVIGDSYASGQVRIEGQDYHDEYSISWPQIMGRKYGSDVTNFTESSLSSRTWLTDTDHGLALMQSSPANDLYLIALGINDKWQNLPIGTSADMTANPPTNPDTFYGNMDQIVYQVKVKAPNAMIVMIGLAVQDTDYNEALRAVAAHNGIPFIDTQSDVFFTSSYYLDNMVANHPTAPIYSGMADAYARLIADTFDTYNSYYKVYKGKV